MRGENKLYEDYVTVSQGAGTATVPVPVPTNIALANNYHWHVQAFDTGWSTRVAQDESAHNFLVR